MPTNDQLVDARNLSITLGVANVSAIARNLHVAFNAAITIVEWLQNEGFCSRDFDRALGGYPISHKEQA